MKKDGIDKIITESGLNNYTWIDPREIVVANWVRVKCMFGCGDYGLGTCPPNTPAVSEC